MLAMLKQGVRSHDAGRRLEEVPLAVGALDELGVRDAADEAEVLQQQGVVLDERLLVDRAALQQPGGEDAARVGDVERLLQRCREGV